MCTTSAEDAGEEGNEFNNEIVYTVKRENIVCLSVFRVVHLLLCLFVIDLCFSFLCVAHACVHAY